MIKGLNLFDGYTEKNLNHNKIHNGWFKTGDICQIKNKKVFLIGRNDNQLNIGGHKVQAELIEKIIEEMDEVKSSLCFSEKNEILGESIYCSIELNNKNHVELFYKKIKNKFRGFPNYYFPEKFIFKKIAFTQNGKKIRN